MCAKSFVRGKGARDQFQRIIPASPRTSLSLLKNPISPHLGADKVDTDLQKTTLSVFSLLIPGNTVLFLVPLVFVTISRFESGKK